MQVKHTTLMMKNWVKLVEEISTSGAYNDNLLSWTTRFFKGTINLGEFSKYLRYHCKFTNIRTSFNLPYLKKRVRNQYQNFKNSDKTHTKLLKIQEKFLIFTNINQNYADFLIALGIFLVFTSSLRVNFLVKYKFEMR